MIKKYQNVAAVFEAGENIYAVSFYGKIFKIQNHSSRVNIMSAVANRHTIQSFFQKTDDGFMKMDSDDLVIVTYKYSIRPEKAVSRRDMQNLEVTEIVKTMKHVRYPWNQWKITCPTDNPMILPFSFITSIATPFHGSTIFACDNLGDVHELDVE